jgi:hypothetical protein
MSRSGCCGRCWLIVERQNELRKRRSRRETRERRLGKRFDRSGRSQWIAVGCKKPLSVSRVSSDRRKRLTRGSRFLRLMRMRGEKEEDGRSCGKAGGSDSDAESAYEQLMLPQTGTEVDLLSNLLLLDFRSNRSLRLNDGDIKGDQASSRVYIAPATRATHPARATDQAGS